MDLSTRVSTSNDLSSELFALKRDLVSAATEQPRSGDNKKKGESAGAGDGSALTHQQRKKAKAEANDSNAAGKKKKSGSGDGDAKEEGVAVVPKPGTTLIDKYGRKVSAPGEGRRGKQKKHLSHKKDAVDADEQRRTVFVGNLPNTTTHKQIEKLFEDCGEVQCSRLRNIKLAPLAEGDKDRGRGVRILRGEIDKSEDASATAYVVFVTANGADAALKKTAALFRGRHLSITHESAQAKAFEPRSSVYLGNIPYDTTDEAIWEMFIGIGLNDVSRVRIPRDSSTGKCKGFGYVEFASRESVVKALKLRDATVGTRKIRFFSVHKSRDPNIQKTTRRDKRAQQHPAVAGVAAAKAGKKVEPESKTREQKKTGTSAIGVGASGDQPTWMGNVADPRKKLSKDLRWLTQHPNDRRAAAKNRHKDRVRASFIKKKKSAKAAE